MEYKEISDKISNMYDMGKIKAEEQLMILLLEHCIREKVSKDNLYDELDNKLCNLKDLKYSNVERVAIISKFISIIN